MRGIQARVPNGLCQAILYLLVLGLSGRCISAARAEVVEEIIVQVNDRVIILSEYQRSLENLRRELAQEASGLELEGLFRERAKDALRDLIDQQLLAEKAA